MGATPSLSLVVVDELGGDLLVTLGHQDVPHMSPLAVDLLEAPDLISDPAVVDAFSDALDELAIALGKPASLEEVLLNLIKSDEPGSTLDGAEEPVRVLAVVEVEAAVLMSAAQARGRLGDVDVGENVG